MLKSPRYILISVLSGLVLASCPAIADWHVWSIPETRHVLREDLPPPGAGPTVAISAARNEWESVQILMRSDTAIRGVKIEPADFTGPDGAVIPASVARLYRQHQFEITTPTYRNKDFKAGWYPDALIPARHPLTNAPLTGARFTALPFDLPANETHGFLVDLHVPADARAGVYHAEYRIKAEGQPEVAVPITLTVWDFELPAVPTMQTEFGSPAGRMRSYYRKREAAGLEKAPTDWGEIEAQCAQMLDEHHIAAPPNKMPRPQVQLDGSFVVSNEEIDALRAFIDRYHVNTIQLPHPSSVINDPEKEQTRLSAWLAAWDHMIAVLDRPAVVFYFYLRDEPNDAEAYQYVRTWGKAIRATKTKVKVLVVEQPQTQDEKWGGLYGAVDIWCPLFCLFEPEPVAQRRALGETIWTYTALCQGKTMTPWWQTDYPLLHYRVPSWIAWRYGMKGLLYWGGLSFWDHVDDPWTDPQTYQPDKKGKGMGGLIYNGEGSLVYPARAVGYDGIVPSLRLKALRDSIEDYEYMCILEKLVGVDEVMKIVLPVTPSWTQWDADPVTYEKARARLAEAIVKAKATPDQSNQK